MNGELIVIKLENKVKECLEEMYQAIDSSFSRIDDYLDQIVLAPYPSIPQQCVKSIPAFPQITLNSIQPLVHEVIKEIKPIFNNQLQQIQLKQQNTKEINQEYILQNIKQNNNHQSNLKPFTFKLIQNHSIKQDQKCRTIAIKQDNSIVLAACDKDIKVFEFKQNQLRQTQILSEHNNPVTTLNFMNKSNQFISASHDKQIIIWSINHNNQWISSQKLNGHSDWIFCLVLNKNEDLIISGSDDKTIKFWQKKQQWLCSQTITDHTDIVCGLSLNEQQNKLISCGYDKFILIIEQSSQDYKWNVIQKITVEQYGYRLCFINDNVFTFQPYSKELMHVYEMSNTNKQYSKTKDILVKSDYNGCEVYFPQQYINSKCLLVNKNGYNVNLIRKNQNDDFITLQSIQFGTNFLFGQMSEDGEYLITWDDKSNEIQIRKCDYE